MSGSSELRPCPFCGTNHHLSSVKLGSAIGGYYPVAVRCHHLDCDDVQGPTGDGYAEAVTLWNRRIYVESGANAAANNPALESAAATRTATTEGKSNV